MNEKRVILVIEDEHTISNFICRALSANDYKAIPAFTGKEGLSLYFSHGPDLVLLDLGLPDMDGLDILRQIRSWSALPVVVVSARSHEQDKVSALDLGADDYLTKPFSTQELMARIRAMTRSQTGGQVTSRLTFGNITLDQATFELSSPAGSFRLANKEFQMMEMLMRNPRQIIPTERFLERIWGYDSEVELSVVWVYISYLRKKLSALRSNIQIKVTRNAGYSLEGPV